MQNRRANPEPAYTRLTSFEERYTVTPRPDAEASVVKYRNASEFEATRFRVKRGMTMPRRFLQQLNRYNMHILYEGGACGEARDEAL